MRSYYDLMELSEVKAEDGTYYPDIFYLPTSSFSYKTIPEEHPLTAIDILRPDIMVSTKYGYSDYYDLLLDINEIGYLKNNNTGDPIYFPTIQELDNYYIGNS